MLGRPAALGGVPSPYAADTAGVSWDMASSGCEDTQGQEEERFLYFAYGSNLMRERIHLRNPSAAFCSVARLQVSAARPAPATLRPLTRRGRPGLQLVLIRGRLTFAIWLLPPWASPPRAQGPGRAPRGATPATCAPRLP